MKVLITGSNGFIGRNLEVYLCKKNINILTFNRKDPIKKLYDNLLKSDGKYAELWKIQSEEKI